MAAIRTLPLGTTHCVLTADLQSLEVPVDKANSIYLRTESQDISLGN